MLPTRRASALRIDLKLKSVGGREVNVSSIPKVHTSADHGMDQSGNSIQRERPVNGMKLAHVIEAGSGNRVRLI